MSPFHMVNCEDVTLSIIKTLRSISFPVPFSVKARHLVLIPLVLQVRVSMSTMGKYYLESSEDNCPDLEVFLISIGALEDVLLKEYM